MQCEPQSKLQFRYWRCKGEHGHTNFAMSSIRDGTNNFLKTTPRVTIMRNLLGLLKSEKQVKVTWQGAPSPPQSSILIPHLTFDY